MKLALNNYRSGRLVLRCMENGKQAICSPKGLGETLFTLAYMIDPNVSEESDLALSTDGCIFKTPTKEYHITIDGYAHDKQAAFDLTIESPRTPSKAQNDTDDDDSGDDDGPLTA